MHNIGGGCGAAYDEINCLSVWIATGFDLLLFAVASVALAEQLVAWARRRAIKAPPTPFMTPQVHPAPMVSLYLTIMIWCLALCRFPVQIVGIYIMNVYTITYECDTFSEKSRCWLLMWVESFLYVLPACVANWIMGLLAFFFWWMNQVINKCEGDFRRVLQSWVTVSLAQTAVLLTLLTLQAAYPGLSAWTMKYALWAFGIMYIVAFLVTGSVLIISVKSLSRHHFANFYFARRLFAIYALGTVAQVANLVFEIVEGSSSSQLIFANQSTAVVVVEIVMVFILTATPAMCLFSVANHRRSVLWLLCRKCRPVDRSTSDIQHMTSSDEDITSADDHEERRHLSVPQRGSTRYYFPSSDSESGGFS